MRRIAALALLALALAGCGASTPSAVVPADATIYAGMDASRAESLVRSLEVDFDRDVKPWLGDRAAYFAVGPRDEAGLVFESEDDEAAEAFAHKVTPAGPFRASAVIDGYLVLTTTRELLRAANAAAGGEALADSTKLDVAGEDEEDAPDALFATSEPRAIASEPFGIVPEDAPIPDQLGDGPLTARFWYAPSVTRAEIRGLPGEGAQPPSLADLSGAAWLAAATGDMSVGDPLAPVREALTDRRRWPGVGIERVLRNVGPGTVMVQGRSVSDIGARLVAETDDEPAVRRDTVAFARGLSPSRYRVDLNVSRAGLQLLASPRGRDASFFLNLENGRLAIDVGETVGGVAEDLGDTERYRSAERQLRGAPTLLIEQPSSGYVAVRDATEDGRRVLRFVRVVR